MLLAIGDALAKLLQVINYLHICLYILLLAYSKCQKSSVEMIVELFGFIFVKSGSQINGSYY